MPIDPQTLKRFINPVFVETGCFRGGGVDAALAAGFERIVSIELHPDLAAWNVNKYKDNPKVTIVHGDSALEIGGVIDSIQTPITFFLDSHGSPEKDKHQCESRVLEELDAISVHPIHSHTILLDDINALGRSWMHDMTEEQVISALLKINPDYLLMKMRWPAGKDKIWGIMGAIPCGTST